MRIIKKRPKCSKDFWQESSEFYVEDCDLQESNIVHVGVFNGTDFIDEN